MAGCDEACEQGSGGDVQRCPHADAGRLLPPGEDPPGRPAAADARHRCGTLGEALVSTASAEHQGGAGRADGALQDVAGRAGQLVAGHSDVAAEFGDCLHAATSLASLGLLLLEDGHHRLGMRLSLSVSHDDVLYSLRSDANIPWLRDVVF